MNHSSPRIEPAVMKQLTAYDWPGNVRELQNAVERAVILAQESPLRFDLTEARPAKLPAVPDRSPSAPVLLTREELKRQERDNIAGALKQAGGKVFGPGGAAELLGMKPTTLASQIRALRIQYVA